MTQQIILTEKQQSAVEVVKTNPVSILTGGPGTGKTTTCKAVLRWAQDEGLSVGCCAPSGKAAKRFEEAVGFPASTIHRLLAAQMVNGSFQFAHNEEYPLRYELVIVDEASMVSNDLMADLLRAIKLGTKLLLVGDQEQLPSVGAGAVLRDLLASKKIPHVELTEIHRNAGDIVKASHRIKQGLPYAPSPQLDPANGLNLRHIERRDPAGILGTIQEIVVNRMSARGFDPIWDVQVISPTNKRTILSCKSINGMLQQLLNPNVEDQQKSPFFPGDKVIQTKNTRVQSSIEIGGQEMEIDEYVVNGDLGQILAVDEFLQVNFLYPDRKAKLSKKENHLLLAYCITCHRMQGSEAPVVIIPVHKSFNFFMNRPWIYTAISRAQFLCITVGQFEAIEAAIKKSAAEMRVTRLKERMIEVHSNHTGFKGAEAF